MIPHKHILDALTLFGTTPFGIRAEQPDHAQWFHETRFGLSIPLSIYAVPAGESPGKPVSSIKDGWKGLSFRHVWLNSIP